VTYVRDGGAPQTLDVTLGTSWLPFPADCFPARPYPPRL